MKKYEVTLCTKLNGHIKLELTEEEAELIVKLSESLKDNKTIWDGSVEVKEVYSHLDKFIKNKEAESKKKLEFGMVVHCATEEEFHRIGKKINNLYPSGDSYNYRSYYGFNIFEGKKDFCFSTLNHIEWEFGEKDYFIKNNLPVTESTEIE